MKKCIGTLLLWVLIVPLVAVADNGSLNQAVVSSEKVIGHQLSDTKLIIDLGRVANSTALKNAVLQDSKGNKVTDVQLNNLDKSSLLIEGKHIDLIKKIKLDNQLVSVNILDEKKDTTKIFVNKERSRFVSNEQLVLEFTQPVDIRTLSNFMFSNKGIVYKPTAIEYYVDYLGVKDFTKINISFGNLKTNELYQLQLSDKIMGLRGEKSILSNEQSILKIVRDIYDYDAPVLANSQVKSAYEVALNFLDGSDLLAASAIDISNFKVTNYATGQVIPVIKSSLVFNSQTKKLSEVRLKVGELSLDQRYQIDFKGIKDVNNNSAEGKTMISFFDYDEKGPRLQMVDALNSNLLRLSFSREVFIPQEYDKSNISIGNNVKVLEVIKDPLINNALLVKTTTHEQKILHRISVEGIQDKYGAGSSKQYSTLTYYPILDETRKLNITMLETGNVKGQYAVTITFTDPLPDQVEQLKQQFSIDGLEVYYIYKISDKQVRVITSPQVAGTVYTIKIDALESTYGATNTPLYKNFAGIVFE